MRAVRLTEDLLELDALSQTYQVKFDEGVLKYDIAYIDVDKENKVIYLRESRVE